MTLSQTLSLSLKVHLKVQFTSLSLEALSSEFTPFLFHIRSSQMFVICCFVNSFNPLIISVSSIPQNPIFFSYTAVFRGIVEHGLVPTFQVCDLDVKVDQSTSEASFFLLHLWVHVGLHLQVWWCLHLPHPWATSCRIPF